MTSTWLRLFACTLSAVALTVVTGCRMFSDSGPSTVAGAQVAEVHGGVRVTDGSRPWRKLSAGDGVVAGNLIQTAMESAVDIIVDAAANRVLLQSDSVLVIDSLPRPGANELHLNLRSGWVTVTSVPGSDGPLSEIKFPKGLAGAHGATFNLAADGNLKVLAGSVVLKMLDDQPARTIAAGTQFDPQTGQVTIIPAGAAMERPAPPSSQPPAPVRRPNDNPFPWIQRPK